MGVTYTTPDVDDQVRQLRAELAAVVKGGRSLRGETQDDAARAMLTHQTTISNVECLGRNRDTTLSLAVKLLDRYGYTLRIVPKEPAAPHPNPSTESL